MASRLGSLWLSDVVVTPDGNRLVVTLGSDGRSVDENNDQVSVFDLREDRCELAGEVHLDDEPGCSALGVSSDSRMAYVATRRQKSPAPKRCTRLR